MLAPQDAWPFADDAVAAMRPWVPWFRAPLDRPAVAGTCARDVALRAGLPLRLDRTAARQLIACDAYDVRGAFFAGVRGAPLGSSPLYVGGGVRLAPPPRIPRLRLGRLEEAVALVRAGLDAATAHVVGGATRVGVALSGGLDSTSVAASAAAVWRREGRDPQDLRAYHFLPPRGAAEVAHARAVAAHLGIALVEVPWPVRQPRAARDAVRRALDAPTTWIGPEPTVALLERMREDGIELLLTGVGGDEAFAAYGMPAAQPAPSPAAARMHLVAFSLRQSVGRALPRRPWRRAAPALPSWLQEGLRRARPPVPLAMPRAGLRGAAARRDASLRCARQGLLVHWWGRAAALHGLRAAHPLLHRRVSDLVLGLPAWTLAVGSERKPLLRRAIAERVPSRAAKRPKDQPYVEPWVRAWLAEEGVDEVAAWLRAGVLEREGLLPREAAGPLLRAAVEGTAVDLYRALAAVGVERWAQAHGL